MDRQSGRKIWKIAEFYNELMFRVPALEQAVRHKGRTYNYYWTMPGVDNMMIACLLNPKLNKSDIVGFDRWHITQDDGETEIYF